MAVNTTNITGITSIYEYASVVDSATEGLFFGLMIFVLFLVLVINMRNQGIEKAIAGASFSCLLISIIFWNIGLAQILFPIAFAIFLGGTLLYLHFRPSG